MNQIGKYKVIRQLGAGGFGAVYLCEDPQLKEQVAVKVFQLRDAHLAQQATSASEDASRVLRERFLSEARVLRKLSANPHIVEVYEFGETADGTPFYVMPYLARSLVDEIGKDAVSPQGIAELEPAQRPRRMPPEQAAMVLQQVLQALSAVHSSGLVHRDIKPANILFNANGVVQLCDFGIAKLPDSEHSQTQSGLAMGSRNYMAPEQRESAKHVSARADVFAFGVLAYRLYTGTLPIGRYEDPVSLCPAMGKAMSTLILQCLSPADADRPVDANALLPLFKQALTTVGGESVQSEHSGTWVESGQGEGGYKAAVSPLEQRVEELLLEHAEIPTTSWDELNALAAIGGIGDVALQSLIQQVSQRLGPKLAAKKNFLKHVDGLANRGMDLRSQRPALLKAAEAIGWDARALDALIFDRQPRSLQQSHSEPSQAVGTPAAARAPEGSPIGMGSHNPGGRSPRWPAALALLLMAGLGLSILVFQDDLKLLFSNPGVVVEKANGGLTEPALVDADSYSRPEPKPTLDAVAQQAAMEAQRQQQEQKAREQKAAEREQKLAVLFRQFDAQIASFKLTKPPGDNAADTLQSLKALDPAHPKVLEGSATLAGKYLELFERDLNAGNLPKAAGYIELAAGFTPESPLVADARAKLQGAEAAEAQRKQQAAEQARLEEERRREEEQARLEAERKRQQTLAGKKPGEAFKDCADCPEMVRLPTGSFLMGSNEHDSEKPPHWVKIDYALAVGKFEVTYDDWELCARSGGCGGYAPNDQGWGRGTRPVINVSWEDAQQYVQWLSRQTGKTYRLLSEAEWEYAARAGTTTAYSTGSCINTSQANYDGNYDWNNCGAKTGVYRQRTVPVGGFSPNAFGLHDMHGNVWEWVQDCWNGSYRGAPADGSAWTGGDCTRRVLRGGSWYNTPDILRSANRGWNTASNRLYYFGFRLARTD